MTARGSSGPARLLGEPVHLTHLELHRVRLDLVTPFRTSFGTEIQRDALLVHAVGPDDHGWGECVAMSEPRYSPEWVDGAEQVTARFLAPGLTRPDLDAVSTGELLATVNGHPMAKAAVECAVLDAGLRRTGVSLATALGATRDRVPAGVAVGIATSTAALCDTVASYVDAGYRRVKLKVQPGHDIEAVRAVRERFGDDLLLQVDANAAYTPADIAHLRRLDAFGLALIEQPFAADDLLGHAQLARAIDTPVCLDESITSLRTAELALELGACSVINIKPGRVGGLLEALRIHDLCLAREVPVWCGGMLETGVGRAANAALAALRGFTLPGDLSASDRYFADDITEPLPLVDGQLLVPTGPGIGTEPVAERMATHTTSVRVVPLGR